MASSRVILCISVTSCTEGLLKSPSKSQGDSEKLTSVFIHFEVIDIHPLNKVLVVPEIIFVFLKCLV